MKQTPAPIKKGVVLLSGGLDSTTVLAIAQSQGYACYCLSFNYGQKQSIELERASHIARSFSVEQHLILQLDLGKIGGSALTSTLTVPKDRDLSLETDEIPVTYVPARNMIFLTHAVAWAEVLGATDLFIGVNAVDYSGYPDCRPEFLEAFTKMANLGTKAGVMGKVGFTIHAPLLSLSKKEIIEKGLTLGVDYSLTHSCYDPKEGKACGRCDSCLLRLRGFVEAGLKDPAPYVR
ncbi:MAG: 7-cyano-7-deazaguanine synthase QueC [Proteobacteria bacterium]|nr:7-cyano-7-deazaguanine synthase QueC [Desulfocapsa sp.]MBU3945515.1 7-cyano-7-deazaguanine synthase QueC [Pseudomonadota bacterium]MCG2745095.1 7-cyano-7-deazaguanine synthase QueC [Desulfobacteraceae bacterium]MBU3982671.1 7-cyano-7-deazaguanine synthase QueC [Pseudomonadota bacterium]MBU4029226.1 7-cyano-7-deazaguanine synthase QueC [Pseudomonadota bacterium]